MVDTWITEGLEKDYICYTGLPPLIAHLINIKKTCPLLHIKNSDYTFTPAYFYHTSFENSSTIVITFVRYFLSHFSFHPLEDL